MARESRTAAAGDGHGDPRNLASGEAMSESIPIGQRQIIDGRLRVFYFGYWVKAYDTPADTLLEKKRLIEALTRRLFNHVEYGINVPGTRLAEARRAFDDETDPARRRVKGAMLAGALFNRVTDVFTKLVELQALGVRIDADNALMHECGEHLQEALTLGRMVLHRSGDEGIDELWGEPFKAFAFPIEAFYNSRYVKIAQSMQAIDSICDELAKTLGGIACFHGIEPLLRELGRTAKVKCETLRTDADIFEVWTSFVVASEHLGAFVPPRPPEGVTPEAPELTEGRALVLDGKDLVMSIARARVPMPKSASEFIERCMRYGRMYAPPAALNVA
jgi:hypothetical protein